MHQYLCLVSFGAELEALYILGNQIICQLEGMILIHEFSDTQVTELQFPRTNYGIRLCASDFFRGSGRKKFT